MSTVVRKAGIPPRAAVERFTVEVWEAETEVLVETTTVDNINRAMELVDQAASYYNKDHIVILTGQTWGTEVDILIRSLDE